MTTPTDFSATGTALPLISVCICTYKRADLLAHLLASLAAQEPGPFRFEIVVVDNDKTASARPAINGFAARWPHQVLHYEVEQRQGISFARNHTVALAQGDYLAFIDDDEMAAPDWLRELFSMLQAQQADTVFGPVLPIFPAGTPAWIIASGLYERPRLVSGARTHSGNGRTCNALVKAHWCRSRSPACFDERLAHSGGEDHDFFKWLEVQGGIFVWNDAAQVSEIVPRERQSLGFILERKLRTSITYWRAKYLGRSRQAALLEAFKGALGGTGLMLLGTLQLPRGLARAAPTWARAMNGYGRVLALSEMKMVGYGSKE